jgi:hypothetical protein
MRAMVLAALCLAGCGGSGFTEEIVYEGLPDSGQTAPGSDAGATDAAVSEVDADPEATTSDAAISLDPSDASTVDAADASTVCSVSTIPPGAQASNLCTVAASTSCPACLPYAYSCPSGTYPLGLSPDAGPVLALFGGSVCSSVGVCLKGSTTACGEAGYTVYSCPAGVTPPCGYTGPQPGTYCCT